MKYLILAIFATFAMAGAAFAETKKIPVKTTLTGFQWGQETVNIYWLDGCEIDHDGFMPKQVCDNPRFHFSDHIHSLNSNLNYPETSISINGVKIESSQYAKNISFEQHDRIYKQLQNGEEVIAAISTPYITDGRMVTTEYRLEGINNHLAEYLSIRKTIINQWKNKTIRKYFEFSMYIVAALMLLALIMYIYKKVIPKMVIKKRAITDHVEAKRHRELVEKITEEEIIRRNVRKKLEAESESD
mgnify:CR=1 FL=1